MVTPFHALLVVDKYQWTRSLVSDVLRKTNAVLNQEFVDDLKLREYPEFRTDCDSRDFLLTVLWEPLPSNTQSATDGTPNTNHMSLDNIVKQMSAAAVRVHLWMLPSFSYHHPPPLLVKSVPSGEGVTVHHQFHDFRFSFLSSLNNKIKLWEIYQHLLGGRPFPTSKHSAWVKQRQRLEEHKKGDVKEVAAIF